jgi:predicted transcriptional regulator
MADEDFFLKEKPVKALVTIRRNREEVYGSLVARKIDTTYAHTIKILSRMEEEELVYTEKDGRKKILHLTDKGESYADKFVELLNTINGKDESTEKIFQDTHQTT